MTLSSNRSVEAPKDRPVLRNLVSRYRGAMAVLAVTSFVGALLEALFLVILTGIAMALIGGSQDVGPVMGQTVSTNVALMLAAGILVIRLGLSLFTVSISARLTARVTTEQRQRLAHAYLNSSWAVQANEPSGRLQELLTTFVGRTSSAVSTLTQAVTALLSLVAFLATGLAIDPLATLAVLVALAAVGAILIPLRRHLRTRSRASSQASLGFANAVAELGSLGMEMQTFGVKDRFAARIDDLTRSATETQRQVQTLSSALPPLYVTLAYATILAGVAGLTVVGSGELATIGAIMLLMLRSLAYGQALSTYAGSLAAASPFLERVESTVERYNSSPADSGSMAPTAPTPLEATAATFAYTDGRPALADATFSIRRGEVVGVIGPSGAGKSTLAQLLLGLRAPTEGSLHAGGVDLRSIDRGWWTKRVAFVAQEASLITGTVAENIRFFREGITDEDLRRAAAQANVLADIEALPDGFDTDLGDRGRQLSGGQRQRMSIARALAGSPELLVLDEPTSALDGRSEALIRETLAALHGEVTIVIIAHRMSTLDFCDRIMVVEGGEITGFSDPSSLLATSAFYRRALADAGMSTE